jgi:hypothetical protein
MPERAPKPSELQSHAPADVSSCDVLPESNRTLTPQLESLSRRPKTDN